MWDRGEERAGERVKDHQCHLPTPSLPLSSAHLSTGCQGGGGERRGKKHPLSPLLQPLRRAAAATAVVLFGDVRGGIGHNRIANRNVSSFVFEQSKTSLLEHRVSTLSWFSKWVNPSPLLSFLPPLLLHHRQSLPPLASSERRTGGAPHTT